MMKKKLQALVYFICCNLLLCSYNLLHAQGQAFAWAKSMSTDEGWSANAYAVTTDAEGNVYTTGSFLGTVDFDPGPGVFSLTTINLGFDQNAYITKMNAAGQLLWARSFKGEGISVGRDIAVDAAGNVYTTGYFMGYGSGIDFDPGPDTTSFLTDFLDPFVCKLDADGNFVWVDRFEGQDFGFNSGYSLNADDNSAVYVTGAICGTVDFDPGPGTEQLATSPYESSAFVCKLDVSDGALLWVKHVEGEQMSRGTDVVYDQAGGTVYVTGTFADIQDFDPDPVATSFVTANGSSAGFILHLDAAGQFIWVKQIGGVSLSSANYCELLGLSLGEQAFYVTGKFTGVMDFDPNADTVSVTSTMGKFDGFIIKLDTAGTFAWGKQIGGDGDNGGQGVALDGHGNVYVTGNFSGTTDFDPAPANTFNLTAVSTGFYYDIFMAKFNPEGNFIWAGQTGKYGGGEELDIDIDPSGNVYTAGEYYGTCDFDPGTGVFDLTPIGGVVGIFIMKMGCSDTTSSSLTIASCKEYVLNGTVYTTSGTYIQRMPNASGCDSTITLNLTIAPVNTAVTQTDGTLTAVASGGVSYQWFNCTENSLITGATAQSYTPTSSGSYAVILTNNDCSDTSDCYSTTTGINEAGTLKGVSLFPNPTSGKVTVWTEDLLRHASCTITNALGQVIRVQEGLQGNRFVLDISAFASGIYFMEITAGDKKARRRIVKD